MKFQARAPASGPLRVGPYRPIVEVAKGRLGRLSVVVADAGEHAGNCMLMRLLPLSNPSERAELAEDARKSVGVAHPHLLSVRDVVDDDSGLGVVSDYIPGSSLATFARLLMVRRDAIAARVLLRMAVDMLSGVGFLHNAEGYEPGGLSPEAVFVGRDGKVRWVELHLLGPLSKSSIAVGHHDRLAYCAPEQLVEGASSPDLRSDVFAIGVIVWEMLQRKRLFAGLGAKVVREQILAGPAPRVSGEGIPDLLADVVERALSPDPSARFEDAAEMVTAIMAACPEIGSHDDVAKLYGEVIGAHPSTRRVERAVAKARAPAKSDVAPKPTSDDDDAGRKSGAALKTSRGAAANAPAARPSPPKAAPARPSPPKTAPARPSPPKAAPARPSPPKAAPARPPTPQAPPARPSAPKAPSSASTPPTPASQSPASSGPTPVMPVPVSVIPLSSQDPPQSGPPSSGLDTNQALTVPAGPKREADGGLEAIEIRVPPAPLPKLDDLRLAPAADEPRHAHSGAPADSIPPPGPDVDELTQAGAQRSIGRCELFVEIAHGGMATVHLGRWLGAGGFAKTVAVKALHRQYARDPEFVSMFLDEARVVARIRHPNVMPIIDLVDDDGELFIVMEYVHGVTLAHLLRQMRRRKETMPVGIALRAMAGALHGLHAAHESKDRSGKPMSIIHRDVSPENIMIGADGYARIIDFGIASALGRATTTQDGQVKGKPSYLAPEQVMGEGLDRRTDVYASSVVLWQALTGRKLIDADNMAAMSLKILKADHPKPSALREGITEELDAIVLKGMSHQVDDRFPDAQSMAEALEKLGGLSSHREVGEWVRTVAGGRLERSEQTLQAVEAAPMTEDRDDGVDGRVREVPPEARVKLPSIDGVSGSHEISSRKDLSFTDINSESSTTGSVVRPRPQRRGLVIGGAVAAAVVLAVVISFAVGGSEPQPGTGPQTGPSAAPTLTATAEPPTEPTTEPTADPTAEPSTQASAEGSAEAGEGGATAVPSASAAASGGAVTPPPTWKPPPPTNPRLPTGI
jgi:eukaryotic-like serine/threonine-protein kinase